MKIAYFAPIFFDYLKQRPQHIAELLSEGNTIYYIEPTISIMRYLFKNDKNFKSRKIKINNNLMVLRASGLCTVFRSLEIFDFLNLNTLSEYVQLKKIIENSDLIWCGDPLWYGVIKRFNNKKLVFDKMDDNEKLTDNKFLKKLIRKYENEIVNKADLVIVSCQKFFEDLSIKRSNVFLIRNGVPNGFNKANLVEDFQLNNQDKVFGYIGMVGKWFDFRVIEIILNNSISNKVVIVGDNLMPIIKHPRVQYVSRVPKDELKNYINKFDVCLYNFKIESLLDTINPVKIYEYLSLNKPVIAASSKETEALAQYLMLYKSENELLVHLNSKISKPFSSDKELELFVYENSWEKRVKDIKRLLLEI